MNRQWFEEKLFTDEPLSGEDRRKLQAYLEQYPDMAKLKESWQHVLGLLGQREMLAPEAGFADRWRTRLEQRSRAEEIRSIWLLFLLSTAALLALLAALFNNGFLQLPELSSLLVSWADGLAGLWVFLRVSWRAAQSILRHIPGIVWFMMASSSVALLLMWSVALNRLVLSKGATR